MSWKMLESIPIILQMVAPTKYKIQNIHLSVRDMSLQSIQIPAKKIMSNETICSDYRETVNAFFRSKNYEGYHMESKLVGNGSCETS